MRLIDADELSKTIKETCLLAKPWDYVLIERTIADAPTIEPDWTELMVICDNCSHAIHVKKADAKPIVKPERKKGRWINHVDRGMCECDICGEMIETERAHRAHYCPNCGAYMGEDT